MATTKDEILEAAIACFAKEGFSGTSTRTLAAAAGVNVATLAYHFGDKEGVYRAAIDRLYERLLALDVPLVSPRASSAKSLETLTRLVLAFMRAHADEVRLLMRHVLDHGMLPTPVRERWTEELLGRAEPLRAALGLEKDPAWRVKLLTVSHLFARYAITSNADLRVIFGRDRDVEAALDDHLVWLTRRILLER